jgi:hypothetical protein
MKEIISTINIIHSITSIDRWTLDLHEAVDFQGQGQGQ